jgi:hypothetical protein
VHELNEAELAHVFGGETEGGCFPDINELLGLKRPSNSGE